MCPLRVGYLFPTALQLSRKQEPEPLKPDVLGAHLPGAIPLGCGA